MKSGLKLKLLTYYLQQDSTLKDYIYSFTILVKVKAYNDPAFKRRAELKLLSSEP